jgi:hypothetical protein
VRCLILFGVLAVASPAQADLSWGIHVGGGLEGGTVTQAARPDGLIEAGTIVEVLDGAGNFGVAVSVDAINRLTSRFDDDHEEVKADAMLRWARDDRRFRFGVGAGIRFVTPQGAIESIRGLDLMRLDMEVRIASWQPVTSAPRMSLDGYFSWTFGCYSDTYKVAAVGDERPMTRALSCSETITSASVLGVRTSVSWR